MTIVNSALCITAIALSVYALLLDFYRFGIFSLGRTLADDFERLSLYSLTILYMVTVLFALIPWSGIRHAGRGIDGHYRLIFWISSIFTVPLLILSCSGFNLPVMHLIVSVLLLVFYLIHLTLLRYHFKDSDPLPPGYFQNLPKA